MACTKKNGDDYTRMLSPIGRREMKEHLEKFLMSVAGIRNTNKSWSNEPGKSGHLIKESLKNLIDRTII